MKPAVCVKGERPESIRVYKTGCPSLAYSCADCQVSIALAGLEGGLQRETSIVHHPSWIGGLTLSFPEHERLA